MSSPSISIIIPLFNGEKYVIESLQSIVDQTYRDWECLIINDGSQDNSLNLVETFVSSSTFPEKFHIITTPNNGVSKARNLGLTKALGKFIAFLDCDDFWESNKLETQIEFLRNNPSYVGCVTSFFIVKRNRAGKFIKKRLIIHRNIQNLTNGWKSLTGNGALISSSLLMRNLPEIRFNENLSTLADLEFFLRLSINKKIHLERRPLANYRLHASQMHSSSHKLLNDFKFLTQEGEFFGTGRTANATKGNVYTLASIYELANKSFLGSGTFLLGSFRLSVFSPMRIVVAVVKKRLKGVFELYCWRIQVQVMRRRNGKS